METVLPPPPPFCFNNNVENATSGNISKEWEKWKTAFLIYFEACELNKKTHKVQINIFLHVVGEQCREVYEQFAEQFVDLKSLLERFDGVFLQRKNITVQRHTFFIREQNDGESVEQFSLELRKLAVKCEFEGLCDDLVRDRLICGIKDGSLRERLLREPKLTLQKAVEICNIAQLSRVQAGNIKKESSEHCAYCVSRTSSTKSDKAEDDTSNQVHWVSRQRRGQQYRGAWVRRSRQGAGRGTSSQQHTVPSTSKGYDGHANQRNQEHLCRKCGMDHIGYKCPAVGKRCLKCNNLNHFSRVCRVHEVKRGEDESNDQVIYYFNNSSNDWCVKLAINNKDVSFKIDTGADVNVLPYNYLETLGIPKDYLIPTSIKLRGYSGSDITVVGSCNLKVKYKEMDYIIEFLIADVTSPPILGRDSCQELSLIKLTLAVTSSEYKNNIFTEYKDVFEGCNVLYLIKIEGKQTVQ